MEWPFEEQSDVVGFSRSGTSIYVSSSLGSDTARLVELDAATGVEIQTLVEDPRCDVGAVMVNPETLEIEAAEVNYQVGRSDGFVLRSCLWPHLEPWLSVADLSRVG